MRGQLCTHAHLQTPNKWEWPAQGCHFGEKYILVKQSNKFFFFVWSTLIARTLVRCFRFVNCALKKFWTSGSTTRTNTHTYNRKCQQRKRLQGCQIFCSNKHLQFLLPNMNEISIQFVYCSCDIRAKLITTANGENKAVYKLQTRLVRLWSMHCQP